MLQGEPLGRGRARSEGGGRGAGRGVRRGYRGRELASLSGVAGRTKPTAGPAPSLAPGGAGGQERDHVPQGACSPGPYQAGGKEQGLTEGSGPRLPGQPLASQATPSLGASSARGRPGGGGSPQPAALPGGREGERCPGPR